MGSGIEVWVDHRKHGDGVLSATLREIPDGVW